MKDYLNAELIWAIAVLAFPVCILIIAVIFKRDISLLIGRIGINKLSNKTQSNENHPQKSESKKDPPDGQDKTSKPTKNTRDNDPTPVDTTQSQVEYPLELCMNNSSHKCFIILEEVKNNKARMIIPTGEIKVLELQLFSEPEIVEAEQYYHLLTEEQLKSYANHITKKDNDYIDYLITNQATPQQRKATTGYEPPYIKSYRNMLKSRNTFPSRMLRCIKSKGRISNQELKDILSYKYGYRAETSGSFSASLRVLFVDGYIDIRGTGNNKEISIIS